MSKNRFQWFKNTFKRPSFIGQVSLLMAPEHLHIHEASVTRINQLSLTTGKHLLLLMRPSERSDPPRGGRRPTAVKVGRQGRRRGLSQPWAPARGLPHDPRSQPSSSSTRPCPESVPSFAEEKRVCLPGTPQNTGGRRSSVSWAHHDVCLPSLRRSPYTFQPTFCLLLRFHLFVSFKASLRRSLLQIVVS